MSMSNDTVYTPADIEVLPCNDKEVSLTNSIIDITPCENTEISVRKKEYTIISDGLYIPEDPDGAPPWVTDLIDDAINPWITDHIIDLVIAGESLNDALDALVTAHNAYTEMVHIDVRVDRAIATHLTTLNARLDNNDASIINLNTTRVTPEEAVAISIKSISSSLNEGSPDSIGGRFTSLGYSISTLAGNVTKSQDLFESRFGELNDAVASLEVEVGAAIDGVYSSFLYDSTLRVGDDSYKSGFGLNASVKIPVPGQPGVYRSEFWIDAQRFKFTNTNQTGAVSPFAIDASGPTPQIRFNGMVSFSNVTGPDKPDANATRNESRGFWAVDTSYYKGDVVSSDGNSWVAKVDHWSNLWNKPPGTSTGSSDTWALFASKGDNGITVTTVQVYRRSASELSDSHKPSTNSTYTFSTASVTGLNNGWSTAVPAGTDPLYVTVASADAEYTADTTTIPANRWSTPVMYVENGLNTATVFLFKRTSSDAAPSVPTNSNGYSFVTHSLTTTPNNGWTESVPSSGGRYRWLIKATAASTGHADIINSSEWSTPRILAEDGVDGTSGTGGAKGADGADGVNGAATTTVYRRATSVTTPSAGTSNPPSGWYSSVPTDSDLPVWECVGNHPGDGQWVWEPPSVSASFWTKPDSTYIDGNKIFTGEAYVDTLEIKGRAITIHEYAETYETQLLTHVPEDGPYETFISKAIVHPGYNQGAVGVIIIVNFAAVGHGHTDIDCRVIRSGWEPIRTKFSVTANMTNSYVAYFFDPNPPVDPTYRVQFRVNDLTGSDSGTIWHTKTVFMSGKR